MKVVFLHPDFGIGGAERLVLDAAMAMKKKGHQVNIVTNQFSPEHCFTELKDFQDGDLEVVAQSFPRTILGKCYALCAYIRFCIAAFYICFNHRDADVVFFDQISAALPILRLFSKASLLFYCHYPDQLLTGRETFGKKLYRLIIDQIEAWTMGWADEILVNSRFTEAVVRDTFPALADRPLTVLHPSINCEFFDNASKQLDMDGKESEIEEELGSELFDLLADNETIAFLSINRFERKKNIELAIQAFDCLLKRFTSTDEAVHCLLVIAGGYDPLNAENVNYYEELVDLARAYGVESQVKFVRSPSDQAKIYLMETARLVIYTPDHEHFGIVPLEAMYLSTPVLAVNNGGPRETVIHEKTGFLRPSDPEAFARCMEMVMDDPECGEELGVAGREHVEGNFSFEAFADKLDAIISNMTQQRKEGIIPEQKKDDVKAD